jgi:hypothetical protein
MTNFAAVIAFLSWSLRFLAILVIWAIAGNVSHLAAVETFLWVIIDFLVYALFGNVTFLATVVAFDSICWAFVGPMAVFSTIETFIVLSWFWTATDSALVLLLWAAFG